MSTKIRKIVFTALMASLICVATMIIKIPTPLHGYINLGDAIVLLAAWTLGPLYGCAAAGIGSALADLFSGYAMYAPATFVIKGLMALVAWAVYKKIKKTRSTVFLCISAILAELLMVVGYYLFEGILYGFVPSLVNVPANLIQALGGIIFGIVLNKAIGKYIMVDEQKGEK
ncbi:MAG: ECF transporter S component [Clostridia bacterium]|nr:ECF transporter S component [Clostridia bacterium]